MGHGKEKMRKYETGCVSAQLHGLLLLLVLDVVYLFRVFGVSPHIGDQFTHAQAQSLSLAMCGNWHKRIQGEQGGRQGRLGCAALGADYIQSRFGKKRMLPTFVLGSL